MAKDHAKPKSVVGADKPHANVDEMHTNGRPGFGTRLWRSEEVMVRRELRNDGAALDELGSEPEEAASDSGGQSGDAQGLSQTADADEESVGELAERDQAYEAGAVDGLEDAADHPEMAVRSHENKGR